MSNFKSSCKNFTSTLNIQAMKKNQNSIYSHDPWDKCFLNQSLKCWHLVRNPFKEVCWCIQAAVCPCSTGGCWHPQGMWAGMYSSILHIPVHLYIPWMMTEHMIINSKEGRNEKASCVFSRKMWTFALSPAKYFVFATVFVIC